MFYQKHPENNGNKNISTVQNESKMTLSNETFLNFYCIRVIFVHMISPLTYDSFRIYKYVFLPGMQFSQLLSFYIKNIV